MAHVDSKDILLSVNVGTEEVPSWKLVACSTSDGLTMSTDSVSIATKCNAGFVSNEPGDLSWEFSNTSYVDKDKEGTSNFISQAELFDMWKDKEVNVWKIESLDQNFEYLRQGKGFISNLGNTADQGDYLQFDLTISGSGELTREEDD